MALRMSAVQLETAPPHVVAGARDLPPGRSWPDAFQAPAIVDLCSPDFRYCTNRDEGDCVLGFFSSWHVCATMEKLAQYCSAGLTRMCHEVSNCFTEGDGTRTRVLNGRTRVPGH